MIHDHHIYNGFLTTSFKETNELKIFSSSLSEIDFKEYLYCGQTFSIVEYRKNKYYLRLSDEHLNAVLKI